MKNAMKYLLGSAFVLTAAVVSASQTGYAYMDSLALSAGTDKSSAWHNYTRVYSKYFDALKDIPIRMLEIGIYKGDSVKFWERYFPNAELHFIDITSKYIQYQSNRSAYHFLDQTDTAALQQLGESFGKFDIIIDDGGHTMEQQIASFKALFPYVNSGGMYVIEDLHTSYWREYGGNGTRSSPKAGSETTIGLLKSLIDDVNYIGASTQCADPAKASAALKNLNEYKRHIESMHFYDSLCIIIRR